MKRYALIAATGAILLAGAGLRTVNAQSAAPALGAFLALGRRVESGSAPFGQGIAPIGHFGESVT